MTAKYTELGTYSDVVTTELNTLADDTAAVAGTPISNDASTERNLLRSFKITLASYTPGATSPQIHLIIVPDDGAGVFSDVASTESAANHIARYADGTAVTFNLEPSAAGALILIATEVQIPNANYKPGIFNQSDAALAATGNIVSAPNAFNIDDV